MNQLKLLSTVFYFEECQEIANQFNVYIFAKMRQEEVLPEFIQIYFLVFKEGISIPLFWNRTLSLNTFASSGLEGTLP